MLKPDRASIAPILIIVCAAVAGFGMKILNDWRFLVAGIVALAIAMDSNAAHSARPGLRVLVWMAAIVASAVVLWITW